MDIAGILAAGHAPVIAILRGLRPADALPIGEALVEAGIRIIEVPLNSPEPFTSVRRLQDAFGDRACIGAGTVLDADAVAALADTGARLMVTPNTDPALVRLGLALGLEPVPGFLTPTEAFAAIAAGATRLKLFPAVALGPGYLRAVREVLPRDTEIWAVGGTGAGNLGEWMDAGSTGIGVGSGLYRPDDGVEQVRERALVLVAAWRRWRDGDALRHRHG